MSFMIKGILLLLKLHIIGTCNPIKKLNQIMDCQAKMEGVGEIEILQAHSIKLYYEKSFLKL